MTVFRWIIGVISLLLAGGWALTVMLYVLRGDDHFRDLGTSLRRWLFTFLLFWFNVEIWGRVVWTIINWK
jgi:hypothetical protein